MERMVFIDGKGRHEGQKSSERSNWERVLNIALFFRSLMAPHSSTLASKIPWTEEPGRLQSMGSLRVLEWVAIAFFRESIKD